MAQAGQIIRASDFTHTLVAAGTETATTWSEVSSGFYNSNYYRSTVEVTFPEGLFTEPPVVVAAGHTGVPGTVMEVGVDTVTTTGCTLTIARANQTNTSIRWVAVQVVGGAGA